MLAPRTRTGPHVRAARDVGAVMRTVILALVPCLAWGTYNTGWQANLSLARRGLPGALGWRGAVLEALSLRPDAASVPACLAHGLLLVAPVLATALLVGIGWEHLFASMRRRAPMPGVGVTALIFTLALPPGSPLMHVALGMSFGIVLAKEVFGGTGMNFLNPALAGLAFLALAWPTALVGDPAWPGIAGYAGPGVFDDIATRGPEALAELSWRDSFLGRTPGAMGVTSTLACLLGAAWLLFTGVASARIMLSVLAGMVLASLLAGAFATEATPLLGLPWYWHLTLGSFAFGAVFMATDPVSAASTGPGRLVYGALIGGLAVLLRAGNPARPDGVVLAILMGNVCAPLIDHVVLRAGTLRRAGRARRSRRSHPQRAAP